MQSVAAAASSCSGSSSSSSISCRQVKVQRIKQQALGITCVSQWSEQLRRRSITVARVIHGGLVHRLRTPRVGDVIVEVNDEPLETPEALQRLLRQNSGDLTFTVLGQCADLVVEAWRPAPRYVRARFDYKPQADLLLPCERLGLKFQFNDILLVLDESDFNYWQACHAKQRQTENVGAVAVGLIPSPAIQEARSAYYPIRAASDSAVNDCFHSMHRMAPCSKQQQQRKLMFSCQSAEQFDRADLQLYEEVAFQPAAAPASAAAQVPLLLLTGPAGIGRSVVADWLCQQMPQKFARPRLTTSRLRVGVGEEDEVVQDDGINTQYMSKEDMQTSILNGEFVEYEEHAEVEEQHNEQGLKVTKNRSGAKSLLGLSLQSIRSVMAEGRTALVECHCGALRKLRTNEFRPLVVFVAAPDADAQERMQPQLLRYGQQPRQRYEMQRAITKSILLERLYRPLFDCIVLCDDLNAVYTEILCAVAAAETFGRWVPPSWILYS